MRILLFGKNGQVARTLREEVQDAGSVIALGRTEADLSAPGAAAHAINTHSPDIIINAAAYTAVDEAEKNEAAAAQLNASAVAEMAAAADGAGAPFIHISTDYVFDGAKQEHYKEEDAPNPLNVYGATKFEGEKAALEANDQSVILRTSWVFSEYGANFVKTMLRLCDGRPELNIVDDQVGGPTAARDIAKAALTIAAKKYRGAPGEGLYHFQGAPSVSWAEFAAKIFEIAGASMRVNPIPTAQYPTPAPRPLRTVLDCSKIERDFGIGQPDWRASLRQVMAVLDKKEPRS